MAKRFYFPDGTASEVTPPAPVGSTTWEHINASGNVDQYLLEDPGTTALASVVYQPDSADDLTNQDACHRQYVSGPLAAQTLTGNIKGQFQCAEDHANNNLFITLKVLVCSADGTTTRATLLAITRATSLETTTTLTNRTFPSTALTNYTCVKGDRLVIEVGLGGNITTATGGVQGHNGTIRWGGSASSGDLPIDETTTTTTWRPWVEFSTDPIMDPVPGITKQRAASLGSICATWALVVAAPLFAPVLLQDTAISADNPPRSSAVTRTLITQSWPQPDWPSQHAPYTPNKASSFDPVVSGVPYSRAPTLPISQWDQPAWNTQQTRKATTTGPETHPWPKTDHGQASVAQWPQPAWDTQFTKKVSYTGPETHPWPKTDAGQSAISQWPQPAWDTQFTRKLTSTGPETHPNPKTDAGQGVIAQWPQPAWDTQQTRKLSTSPPIVADNPIPLRRIDSIVARWSETVISPLWQRTLLQDTAFVAPTGQPPKPVFPAAIYRSWEPKPLEPVWGSRLTQDAVQPSRDDSFWAIYEQWKVTDWPTQQTRKVPTSGPAVTQTPFSRAAAQPIAQWPQPEWNTQHTKKLTYTGPETHPWPKTDAGQLEISQWPQAAWDTQVTRKVTTTGPEVYPVSRTDYAQQEILASWPQPEWPTQQTKKLTSTGPETHPWPKTDAGQRSVAQWPQADWASQTAPHTPPQAVVVTPDAPPIKTDAGQASVRQWPQPEWDTQQTRKATTSGPTVTTTANTDAGQLEISQWPQPAWDTQQTKKRTVTGPEVYPVSRTDYGQLEISQWPQAEWLTQVTRKTPIIPSVTPPVPKTDAGQRAITQWPQPEWPTQVTRKRAYTGPETHPNPKTDAGQRSVTQWPQPEWPTQTTRKQVQEPIQKIVPYSRAAAGAIPLWPQPDWPTQQTRKRTSSDVLVLLSGLEATASTGTITGIGGHIIMPALVISQGRLIPVFLLPPSGLALTTSMGTVVVPNVIALTGQSATSTRGTVVQSLSVALRGAQCHVQDGTLLADLVPQLTVYSGLAVPLFLLSPTGQAGTMEQGRVTPNAGGVVPLVGIAMTATPGSVLAPGQMLLVGLPSTATPGTLTVDVRPTDIVGQVLTSQAGFVTASGNTVTVNLSGASVTITAGLLDARTFLTGQTLTGALGTLGQTATVGCLGSSLTAAIGIVAPVQGPEDTFLQTRAGIVRILETVPLVGSSLTVSVGTMTASRDASFALTGVQATTAPGQPLPLIAVLLIGQSATSTPGMLGAPGFGALTGQAMTVQTGLVFVTTDRTQALIGAATVLTNGALPSLFQLTLSSSVTTLITGTLGRIGGNQARALTGAMMVAQDGRVSSTGPIIETPGAANEGCGVVSGIAQESPAAPSNIDEETTTPPSGIAEEGNV